MVQDSADKAGLGDEGKDLHLGPAAKTGQRVDLVDTVDELRPTFSQSASGRGRLDAASPAFGRVVLKLSRRTQAVGIGPVEMDEMLSGLGDMDEHSCHELQGVKERLVIDFVAGFWLVEEKLGLWVKAKPGQVHRGTHEIAGEPVKPLGVVGIDGGVIVNAET